eukprot:m51a1_g10245 hypothetical protein (439) ;mRNA; f:36096-38221
MGERAGEVEAAWASVVEYLRTAGLDPAKVVGEQRANAIVDAKVGDPLIAAAVAARWREVSPATFGAAPPAPADISDYDIGQRLATPFERVPSIDDLEAFLQRPAPVPIPVTTRTPLHDSVPLEVFAGSCSGVALAFTTAIFGGWGATVDKGEATLYHHTGILILDVIEKLSAQTATPIVMSRNKADNTATVASMCPDALGRIYGNALVFKSEERLRPSEFDDAVDQLRRKMGTWNPVLLGPLPYLLCYAATVNRIAFYAVRQGTCDVQQVSMFFRLSDPVHRALIVRTCINIVRTLVTLDQHRLVLPSYIRKATHDPKIRRMGDLVQLYHMLSDNANLHHPDVPYVVQCRDPPRVDHKGRLILHLAPLGLRRLPEDERTLASSITCVLSALSLLHELGYAHRDVRWPNVLWDPIRSSWFLIDLEYSARFGEPVNWDND